MAVVVLGGEPRRVHCSAGDSFSGGERANNSHGNCETSPRGSASQRRGSETYSEVSVQTDDVDMVLRSKVDALLQRAARKAAAAAAEATASLLESKFDARMEENFKHILQERVAFKKKVD